MVLAFESPKWEARALAIEDVDRRVPYRSKARVICLPAEVDIIEQCSRKLLG